MKEQYKGNINRDTTVMVIKNTLSLITSVKLKIDLEEKNRNPFNSNNQKGSELYNWKTVSRCFGDELY